jgi:hypothetical protein
LRGHSCGYDAESNRFKLIVFKVRAGNAFLVSLLHSATTFSPQSGRGMLFGVRVANAVLWQKTARYLGVFISTRMPWTALGDALRTRPRG